jgi:hypothetical protein
LFLNAAAAAAAAAALSAVLSRSTLKRLALSNTLLVFLFGTMRFQRNIQPNKH